MTRIVSTLKTQLVGRHRLSLNLIGPTLATLSAKLDPNSIGDRPLIVAAAFERYKIVQMSFHFRSSTPSTVSGHLYMGVHDDAAATAAQPTTGDQLLNLRTSTSFNVWKDATITYVPVDKERWYYTNPEATASDSRFVTQATFYIASDTANNFAFPVGNQPPTTLFQLGYDAGLGEVDVEYHYVFDGASIIAD
jgi:hypothetical protein